MNGPYDAFRTWMTQRPSSAMLDEDWIANVFEWCMHVPNRDMLHFHQPEWVDYMKPILHSKMRFNPIRADRSFVFARNQLTFQSLPNSKYRALLLHVIKRVPAMPPHELGIATSMLMAMEENNITGFVHVPRVAPFRALLREVASIYDLYDVKLEIGYTYIHETSRIVDSVVLCNTSVVFLINARLRCIMGQSRIGLAG